MIDIWAEQKRQYKKMLSVVSTAQTLNSGKTVMMINPRFSIKLTPEVNLTRIEWIEPKELISTTCVFDEALELLK